MNPKMMSGVLSKTTDLTPAKPHRGLSLILYVIKVSGEFKYFYF
jgi:hypothetical protein